MYTKKSPFDPLPGSRSRYLCDLEWAFELEAANLDQRFQMIDFETTNDGVHGPPRLWKCAPDPAVFSGLAPSGPRSEGAQ